ncbi:MAG: right-handed parallel beta-helix repeat-containing protein [Planctomycetaceae bacterium]|nr:right-handed parallel beta-helix repeat-containing protein [Planctomycetaceae bacterium]
MKHRCRWVMTLLGMLAVWPCLPAAAQSPERFALPETTQIFTPFVDWTAGTGNRSDYRAQIPTYIPLHQSEGSLLFGEINLTVADDRYRGSETVEWNTGLGYRTFMDDYSVFGTYLFVDHRKTANLNSFYQTTVGFEWMTVDYECRLNGYFPERDGQPLGPAVAVLNDDRIYVQGDEELAYYGGDLEFGALLADWMEGDVELRAFAGGYYYNRDVDGFQDIGGPRVRGELRVYDIEWFGLGSRLVVTGEFQHDNVRNGQVTGLVTLRIPFPAPGNRPKLSRLQRRLVDPVVRDVDIVTQNGTRREIALDKETGLDLGPVVVVDAMDDFQAEVDAAGEDALILVNGDQGQIDLVSSISLMKGQTLRGAGFTVVGSETGKEAVFGEQPTIELADPTRDIILLDDRTRVRDLMLSQGRNAILGANVTEIRVDGNFIDSPAESGIRLVGTSEGDIDENSIFQAGGDAVAIDTYTSGTVLMNRIAESGGSGVSVQELNGGTVRFNEIWDSGLDGISVVTLADGTVGDNTLTENSRHGVYVATMNGGTVENNTAEENGLQGFQFDLVDFNVTNNPEITNNTATRNLGDGFRFTTLDGGNVTNNTATENQGDGFRIITHSFGSLQENTAMANLGNGFAIDTYSNGFNTDNSAEGNTLHGFQVGTFSNGFLSRNTATDNGLDGFNVATKTGGFFEDNTATGNRDGFSFGTVSGGFFQRNTATSNTRDGFFVDLFTGIDIENNVASQNGVNGFHLNDWTNGALNDNTSTSNSGAGFLIINQTGGTATGNIATGNADNTLP